MLGWFFQTDGSIVPLVLRLTLAVVMFPHGAQKTLGWFIHAHSNIEWFVRLVFRVGKNTFKQEDLDRRLNAHGFDLSDVAQRAPDAAPAPARDAVAGARGHPAGASDRSAPGHATLNCHDVTSSPAHHRPVQQLLVPKGASQTRTELGCGRVDGSYTHCNTSR